jgi:hypothetical protein
MDVEPLLRLLSSAGRLPAAGVLDRLGTSRATLMRTVRAAGDRVVVRGKARRTVYAATRPLRGRLDPIPLFEIDAGGHAREAGQLQPVEPRGCALDAPGFQWPMDEAMRDGWFEGLPYPIADMRPQGYLGRTLARTHSTLLQVPEDPRYWSDDDVLHALSVIGVDLPGNLIVGEASYRQWQASRQRDMIDPAMHDVERTWPVLAQQSMLGQMVGSSAGGEFPKFTTVRMIDGRPVPVLVKFSGSDDSPGSRRWSDLLVCEHLAAQVIARHLEIPTATTRIHRAGDRTFLEVERFDRHGLHGRSALCSWASLNDALFGLASRPWTEAARRLRERGWIDAATDDAIARLWCFGQLIGNTDMHDGNLSFTPVEGGLALAPIYDMLPMMHAPQRGIELPERNFEPVLPMPSEQGRWRSAARAAVAFWRAAEGDERISPDFREVCRATATTIARILDQH